MRWPTFILLAWPVCVSAGATVSALPAGPPRTKLLPDGLILSGVDGLLRKPEGQKAWFFELEADANEAQTARPPGTLMRLVESLTLEKMIADTNERTIPRYRLWARVTAYRGSNFVFPLYYLPLSKIEPQPTMPPPPDTRQKPSRQTAPLSEDSAGALQIPREILARLEAARDARRPRLAPASRQADGPETDRRDYVVTDMIGFIRRKGTDCMFVPDCLGRNVQSTRFVLIPCRALESAERMLVAVPDEVRLAVAGTVTEYQDTKRLLLHRVLRVYGHGNFGE